MTIVFVGGLLLILTLILQSKEAIRDFLKTNDLRIGLILLNFWIISAGLVIVPNFAQLFGALGYNADQSTIGIALLIVLAFVKGSSSEKKPEPPADPIPN